MIAINPPSNKDVFAKVNTYIDKSELRKGPKQESKALYLIDHFSDDENMSPLSDLESLTGADLMISPNGKGLPYPATQTLLKMHIKAGAFLVQLKFGHDLISSVLDGRVKEALARMKLSGAAPWQRILLFVGNEKSGDEGELIIDGQSSYSKRSFSYKQFLGVKDSWLMSGGFFDRVAKKDLVDWIEGKQRRLDKAVDEKHKFIYPKSPILTEKELQEFNTDDFIESEWQSMQELELVTDWRNMLNVLPGVADKKIRAIVGYMEDNNIERSWYKFIEEVLYDNKLTDIPGIGTGIETKIRQFLNGE